MQMMTFEELQQKRDAHLVAAEGAVHRHGDIYREIKQLVREINRSVLDVAEYHLTARRLGKLLGQMADGLGTTIFDYYAEHIDPCKAGDVRCFRMECEQLSEQISEFDHWRAARRRLRMVK